MFHRIQRCLVLMLLSGVITCNRAPEPDNTDSAVDLSSVLSGAAEAGYQRASGPRDFAFPADHGPHPGFRTEWWYVTGVLETTGPSPRRFGYQLTFFRQALAPVPPQRSSQLAAGQVYMGHVAVSDINDERFFASERFERSALGLAGARAHPFAVWLDDWRLQTEGNTDAPDNSIFPLDLRATTGGGEQPMVTLALTLAEGKGPILQGERGYSRKGPEPGNASYYYSVVRLPTQGKLNIGGQVFRVRGQSWLDREWSTSALSPGLVGWDWLALHMDDGRELMVYRLRGADGRQAPHSRATIIGRDGKATSFGPKDFQMRPRNTWKSPRTGITYPAGFEISIRALNLSLDVTPMQQAQELPLSVRYWEGAVKATGTQAGSQLSGTGYLEMTGYDQRPHR